MDVCTLAQIPNKEGGTYDDGYRPKSSVSFKTGDLVKINEGAQYYGGQSIPDWVKSDRWYVKSINGDRVVLGENRSKTRNINSPIKSKDIQFAKRSIDNADDVKALTVKLKDKGYDCDQDGVKNDRLVNAMFDALCDSYSL